MRRQEATFDGVKSSVLHRQKQHLQIVSAACGKPAFSYAERKRQNAPLLAAVIAAATPMPCTPESRSVSMQHDADSTSRRKRTECVYPLCMLPNPPDNRIFMLC